MMTVDFLIGAIRASRDLHPQVKTELEEILFRQEPVKPERETSGSGVTWWNVCGSCRTAINPNDKFCHECGKPVDWS